MTSQDTILLINDANILIDLLKLDLLDDFLALPCEFHVPDLVLDEILEANRAELDLCIDSGQLEKKIFGYEELMEIQLLSVNHRRLSIPDCSCLFHARKTQGRLLTGDGALRRTAQGLEIPVHGILWVFDQLVEQGKITRQTAHDKLSELDEINPRLPKAEVKKRLKKWT